MHPDHAPNDPEVYEEITLGFKERMKLQATWYDRMAEFMTKSFGTVAFFLGNGIFFFIWIIVNLGYIRSVKVFDPYPFGLLTMIVSLEAIFLSIIVLISQNRESKIADLRQEMDFEINVRSEEEITKILLILDEIHDHLGLNPEDDKDLVRMKKQIDIHKMGQDMMNNGRNRKK